MARNLKQWEWIQVLTSYKNEGILEAVHIYKKLQGINDIDTQELRSRIRKKYRLVQNRGMEILQRKLGSGRPKKSDYYDIDQIINDLNDEQKDEIIRDWIKHHRKERNKKGFDSFSSLSPTMKSRLLGMHRTTFYKENIERTYQFDWLRSKVERILEESKYIYGSRKISLILEQEQVYISDRTLRNYMNMWGLHSVTRKRKRKSEVKNINVKFKDLVCRNYLPSEDNIIATDVSYIPANEPQNNVYLSIAISHKTKLIESWQLSTKNDNKLVIDTILGLKRIDFIFHSDHGFQYSSPEVREILINHGGKTSMGRIGNSLDNREAEYFFNCLKSEYLYHLDTASMKYKEIYKHIEWYINWYNNKRIQKVLQWKTPAFASVYSC